ncbi:protein prenylyltransferase [Dothidotthia symphoricarpi CBS 119687]|uniref:Protein prenylyltransferase n=1 Tax=Dothidotthia symphoricarpi CBS 119687 TaxID=1392245 RepID=A0A6A6A936_9PLEO|nr:protein prenylyltransferase [Dothidotthia symphoricarpi CBS 119687]KAF2127348.1 protein prenylyltransferase [Dothidotthia symphoricarpi CBS 119687]
MAPSDSAVAKLQKLAYDALNAYFEEHVDAVIEIEILPPAIQPPDGILMKDGSNLGVPKKILALAFVEARKLFFEKAHDNKTSALQATKVMLLFDPEHLTAAHFRKRRLLELKSEVETDSSTEYQEALQQELCFLNSILTSPLHRQSKSPTLWYHRLWLVTLLMPIKKHATQDQITAFWQSELDAVCRSGEQHPKNYYAWQYARRLVERLDSTNIVLAFSHSVKEWCCKHPSDISGWSFLQFLMMRLDPVVKRLEIAKDVLSYALDLQAEQESLWVFLRTVLAHDTLQDGRDEIIEGLHNHSEDVESIGKPPALSHRITQTLQWVQTYGGSVMVIKPTSTTRS